HMIVETGLMKNRGLVRCQDEGLSPIFVEHDEARMSGGDDRGLVESRLEYGRRLPRRIDAHLYGVGFEDPVRRALGIVAAALVEQHGDVCGGALPIDDAELQPMVLAVRLVGKRLDRRE